MPREGERVGRDNFEVNKLKMSCIISFERFLYHDGFVAYSFRCGPSLFACCLMAICVDKYAM